MNNPKPHWRKRKQVHMLMWAMLHHSIPHSHNKMLAWLCLLEWARLGGTREEGTR